VNGDLMRRVDRLLHDSLPHHPEIIDLSHVLDTLTGTVFEDGWHLLPAGNAGVAQAMLAHLRHTSLREVASAVPGARHRFRTRSALRSRSRAE
jgi:hypothetical protein